MSLRRLSGHVLFAGACLLTLGAGCVQFHDRPLSAERSHDEFRSRTLHDPGLLGFMRRNGAERTSEAAPWGFSNLVLAAFYFHPGLDVARAQLAGAEAARVTAGERPNPGLSLGPAYDTTTGPPWILGVDFDLPLETMGKRGLRIAQASRRSEAARLQLAAAAWEVRRGVRENLLALYAAGARKKRLAEQEAIQSEHLGIVEKTLGAGDIAPVEAGRARVTRSRTRLAAHDADRDIAVARVRLAQSVGVPPSALDGVALDFAEFEDLPGGVPDAVARTLALLNRADLRASLLEYEAAQAALQLEIAKQYPDVHLGPGYERDQSDNKWKLGLSIELPLGNRNGGAIAEAEARRAECAARFNELQARVLSEIEEAAAACRVSVGKAAAATALRGEVAAQARAADALFAAGEISRLDLTQHRLELAEAELEELAARVEAQAARGALDAAMQAPAETAGSPDASPRPPSGGSAALQPTGPK